VEQLAKQEIAVFWLGGEPVPNPYIRSVKRLVDIIDHHQRSNPGEML
jgi:hypothetical protein